MHTEERRSLLSKRAGLATVIAAGISLSASTVQAAETTVSASDPLEGLHQAADAVDAAYAAYLKSSDRNENEKLWTAYTQRNDSLVPKIVDAVRQSPTSSEAFGLLEWVVTNGRLSIRPLHPYGLQAMELLRDHYTLHTNLSRICRVLGISGDSLNQPTVEFLQLASAKNPDRASRAYAAYALAELTRRKAEEMSFWQTVPSSIYTNAATQKVKAAFADQAKTQSPDAILHEAEQLFQTVKTDYSDVPNFPPGPGLRKPETTLGEQANIELYECQHLSVGNLAPEIQGEDLDGHKLRLSDYRGKVVIISFWASWCGPCMQMVPHEASITQRLAGKPFVVVGVNGDSAKTDAKRAVTEKSMTWQSFWNSGSEGGIAGTWNVHAWPTVYVLDAKGTIRLKFEGYGGKNTDALLDTVVDQLLQETGEGGGAKI